MVSKFKSIALAGALTVFAAPAFAQVPPMLNPLGLDLDPFHIFSPAPAPMMMEKPMMKKPMMHKKMMHKKMMKKKMMMKK